MGKLPYIYSDGGRYDAGFKTAGGDCVTRAIALATGLPYREVYERLCEGNFKQRRSSSKVNAKKEAAVTKQYSAAFGVNPRRKWFKDYMRSLGFEWTPTMHIGSGCQVHLAPGELPEGRLCVQVSKHLCAVIDGVVHDTFDPQRGLSRCVYGYWKLKEKHNVLVPVAEVPRRREMDQRTRDLWAQARTYSSHRWDRPAGGERTEGVPSPRPAADAPRPALSTGARTQALPAGGPGAWYDVGGEVDAGGSNFALDFGDDWK